MSNAPIHADWPEPALTTYCQSCGATFDPLEGPGTICTPCRRARPLGTYTCVTCTGSGKVFVGTTIHADHTIDNLYAKCTICDGTGRIEEM